MKNFKLILKSLFSNNTCIDGGRKKKWYFAVIIFFVSTILALVPIFVHTITTQGDDVFENHSYGLREASFDFSKNVIAKKDVEMKIQYVESSDENSLYVKGIADGETYTVQQNGKPYVFAYFVDELTDEQFDGISGDGKHTFVIFTSKTVYVHIVNPSNGDTVKNLVCVNAYKYFEDGFDLKGILVADENQTTAINKTWDNWKSFYSDAYDFNRYTTTWQQCLIIGSIDIIVTFLMGFMVWVLTRGKNNPYRIFNFWEGQKIAYWASITPAILTCGFGFLFTNFANALFPLLLGVRVMWLSMKSLRPDGSGYAAN